MFFLCQCKNVVEREVKLMLGGDYIRKIFNYNRSIKLNSTIHTNFFNIIIHLTVHDHTAINWLQKTVFYLRSVSHNINSNFY